jgi:hypothetical protein
MYSLTMPSHYTPEQSRKYYEAHREKLIEYQHRYNKEHKEKIANRHARWVGKNIETVRTKQREWYLANRERILSDRKIYRIENIEHIKEYLDKNKEKIKSRNHDYNKEYRKIKKIDPMFKLNENISSFVGQSVRKNRTTWKHILPYNLEQLKTHLEMQFDNGMSWENYGRGGWHIDHIIPRSYWIFNSYTDGEFKQCWALANLQPLWEKDNLKKGNRYA